MTEQEKKAVIEMVENTHCYLCQFKEVCDMSGSCSCMCKKLAHKLDREIVPYG